MSQQEQPNNLAAYYNARAVEYDDVYRKPERQDDISSLGSILRKLLGGHSVLEVACGTGFWTEKIAPTVSRIHATDVNDRVLEIASKRLQGHLNVTVARDDAFLLDSTNEAFTAAFAGFWWSHLRKGEQLSRFLDVLHSKVLPGALVVFVDNRYVEGNSLPISRRDKDGNTYQKRQLKDGAEYDVLKNFPEEAEFGGVLEARGSAVDLRQLTYYWCVSYKTNGDARQNV